ncbi:MAG: hypothetical protein WCQ72_06255 [Eubacteriales bacterium]
MKLPKFINKKAAASKKDADRRTQNKDASPAAPAMPDETRERILTRVSNVTMIAAALALLLGFVFALYKIGAITLPEPLRVLIEGQGDGAIGDVTQSQSDEFFSALREGKTEGMAVTYDISDDDYAKRIALAPFIDEYTAVIRVTVFDGETRSATICRVWRSGDKYRVDKYSGSDRISSAVCDGTQVAVTDYALYDEPVTRKFPINEDFSLAAQAGLPSLDDFLHDESATGKSISLIRSADRNVYSVSYDIPVSDTGDSAAISNRLLISLEYGLCIGAESTLGSIGIYSAAATSVSEGLSAYNGDLSSIFRIY